MANRTSVPATASPPRAPPIKYPAPMGTRWAKETAAAGGVGAFDLPTDPKSIGPWILGECVGKGASGRVKIAKHRVTGQFAAVKILPIAPILSSRTSLATQQEKYERQRLGIDREITMMKLMNHPNIIRIYDVFEGERELYLVLEYVEGGELFDFLVNRGRLPGQEALAYFRQIIYGLSYAHRFSIIHRDLKPENILIATISPPLIKIADWGMAAFAPPTLELDTSCGSPHYASPEIVNGAKYEGTATDIWSCGVILFALLTGRLPFDDKNVKILLSKVKSGKYEMPSWIEPQAQDLLSKMLVVNVKERITIEEILKHPWFLSSSPSPAEQATEISPAQLAPSPSTLARPIASPSQIDPELFASLQIIWGRHADRDGEIIKQELCSPEGEGQHTKAFYYLLNQHREETKEPDTCEHDLADEGRKLLLYAPDFLSVSSIGRVPRELPTMSRGHAENTSRPAKIVLPLMRRSSLFDNSSSRTSRDRPSCPVGPRELPNGRPAMELARPLMDAPERADTSHREGSQHPSRIPPRRGYTYSHPADADNGISSIHFPTASPQYMRANQRPRSIIGIPGPSNQHRSNPARYSVDRIIFPQGKPRTVTVEPPSTGLTRQPSIKRKDGSSFHKPHLRALGGKGTSHTEDRSTPLSAPVRATERTDSSASPEPKSASPEKPAPTQDRYSKRASHVVYQSDKENQEENSGLTRVGVNGLRDRGIGLGMSREVGRALNNVLTSVDNAHKAKKDMRHRPPTLDFRNLNLGPGKPSALGSPIQLSRFTDPPPSSGRSVTSPVVGEFKEWFQNLFTWKYTYNQGGALYSFNSVSQTRADAVKLLQDLGVVVENEHPTYAGDMDVSGLRCRVNDISGNTWSGSSNLKFRIEFYLAPRDGNPAESDGRPSNPRLLGALSPSVPNTPVLSAPLPSRSRHSILLSRRSLTNQSNSPNPSEQVEFPSGAECAIVMLFEKGSVSTFKTIWRRLKEVYSDQGEVYPAYSPVMNTPVAEHPGEILA